MHLELIEGKRAVCASLGQEGRSRRRAGGPPLDVENAAGLQEMGLLEFEVAMVIVKNVEERKGAQA